LTSLVNFLLQLLQKHCYYATARSCLQKAQCSTESCTGIF